MPSIKDLIIFSALLLQVFPVGAAPAPADACRPVDHYNPLHASVWPCETWGETDQGHENGKDKNHNGSDGGNHGDHKQTTVTVTSCKNIPTTTIIITTTGSNAGDCMDTGTLIQTITDCTATTTDISTITAEGSTITTTVTTPGPTTTATTTTTIATDTITVADVTETETITEVETSTVTDTITLTEHDVTTTTTSFTTTETETFDITTTQTTTEIITTTVTADDCTPTGGDGGGPDYGSCSDPTILYEFNGYEYIYTTNNQVDFPFGESPTIQSPAALICNRLESPCNAPADVVAQCRAAIVTVSTLVGQDAADTWNELITGIVS